jgi:hypothetical protein
VIFRRPDGVPFYDTERGLIMPLPCMFREMREIEHRWAIWWGDFEVRVLPDDRPLAGHSGSCDKVTHATITGETNAPCTCRPQK